MPETTTTITFGRTAAAAADGVLQLTRDTDYEEQTGREYYVLVRASADYTMYQSVDGEPWRVATGVAVETEEDLVIRPGATSAELPDEPDTAPSWAWQGRDLGTPEFDGRRVSLPDAAEGLGVLRVSYATSADRWQVAGGQEVTVLAVMGDNEATLTITPDDTDGDTGDGDDPDPDDVARWQLRVVDYCVGDPISGARVAITGGGTFITDSDGIADLGEWATGTTLRWTITADGYKPSSGDSLNNDGVTLTPTSTDDADGDGVQLDPGAITITGTG